MAASKPSRSRSQPAQKSLASRTKSPVKPTAAKPSSRAPKPAADFDAAFAALKHILMEHVDVLRVVADGPAGFSMESTLVTYHRRPVFFGGVRKNKNYVSFHLMPIYMNPKLKATISPALKKRMQGKACFNFVAPDEALFADLAALTRAGLTAFSDQSFFDALEHHLSRR